MKVLASILVALFVALGCGGTAAAPSAVPFPRDAATGALPTPTPSVAVTSAAPSGLPELGVCAAFGHCEVPAGSYVTGGAGFFPGLEITVPEGWFFGEQDAGELQLRPKDRPDVVLSLAKDVRVIATTRGMGPENEIVDDVAGTPEAFVEWFTNSSDFTVIEGPTAASIAGTAGTVLALGVSKSAAFGDSQCPANPRCADIYTDPAHWGPNVFSIGGDEAARMYLASIPYAGMDHLLAVNWIVPSAADLPAFVVETQPIADSIKVPEKFIQN